MVAPTMQAGIDGALDIWRAQGAEVREVALPPLHDYQAANFVVLVAEAFSLHEPWMQERFGDYGELLRDRMAYGGLIAATDYVSEVPDQIRQFLPHPFATLGADGAGFSDTRPAARRFFHIDTASIVVRALQMLASSGEVDISQARKAAETYALLDVNAGTTGTTGGDS